MIYQEFLLIEWWMEVRKPQGFKKNSVHNFSKGSSGKTLLTLVTFSVVHLSSEQLLITISSDLLFTLHQFQDMNPKLFIWSQSLMLVSLSCRTLIILVIFNISPCPVKMTS